MEYEHENWRNPDDVEAGIVYIAWINGTLLPHFRLLAKDTKLDKNGNPKGKAKWRDENANMKIPRKWIAAVHELPCPKKIGPDWMGKDR